MTDYRIHIMQNLERLRQKPVHVRNRISLFLTTFIFLFIFSAWLFTKQGPTSEQSIALTGASSPLAVVATTFMGMKEQTASVASSLKDITAEMQAESENAEFLNSTEANQELEAQATLETPSFNSDETLKSTETASPKLPDDELEQMLKDISSSPYNKPQ